MSNLAQDFKALLGGRQQGRILTMSFPHNDAPAPVLLANRLEGTEALSRDFEFTVEILSDNAGLALKDFIGKLLSVQLVRGMDRYAISVATCLLSVTLKPMVVSHIMRLRSVRGCTI